MPLQYSAVQTALDASSFDEIAAQMRCLMLRNIAGAGYGFVDPRKPHVVSLPGCVIASPSYPTDEPAVTDQWYTYNWTRDAALTATELAAHPETDTQFFADYVDFAATCQAKVGKELDWASYRMDGERRPDPNWPKQSDGPALQTLAILAMWGRLDPGAQQRAKPVIAANLAFLLDHYQEPTCTLWEEREGHSFFARAVQRRCFAEIMANTVGLDVPAGLDSAIAWLDDALKAHWDQGEGYYRTIEEGSPGYDSNIDIVLAALYGSIPTTDPKLLATAATLHRQWSKDGDFVFPINVADHDERQIGPLFGRYPDDHYDGDTRDGGELGHPWALCTCAFAELCYRVAEDVDNGDAPVDDPVAAPFFQQVGGTVDALREAGDRMLRAVVFHSDHLELSEQFDKTTGFIKSVRNLTWSYSAFLSAVRAR